jgi:integrase
MTEPLRIGDRVSIYPRGKLGTYCADFWHENKHKRISLKTRNRRVAEQRALALANDLLQGSFKAPPPSITIREAVENYLQYLATEGRARKTLVRYRGELYALRDFCESHHVTRLSQINISLFDRYRAYRKDTPLGPRSMFHEGVVIKQWLKWCTQRKWLVEHPLSDYKLSKPRLERRGGPSWEQVEIILATAAEPLRTYLAVLAFTGMRSGEMQRLKPEHIDLKNNWIHIFSLSGAETKTRVSRKVPIHDRLRPFLTEVPTGDREWFFTAPPSAKYPHGDNWLNTKLINESFLELLRKLGISAGLKSGGFTLHSMRHFFETFCTNEGIPQRVVDAWLGHLGDQSMASVYYKLSDDDSQAFMKRVPFGTGEPAADAGKP